MEKYNNDEEKILISKVLDKIDFVKIKNKVQSTDFLNLYEQELVVKLLKKMQIKNYILEGGIEEAERKILILYPEKLKEVFEDNKIKIDEYIKVYKITLPQELQGKYSHKEYLGGFMKLGIKREKIGDIIFDENGADVLILPEMEKYLENNIKNLIRFKKSEIEKIKINQIRDIKENIEERTIIVPSMRMDAVVSELINTSRNKANEIIAFKRVFVNQINETKLTKEIKLGDKITIRGKGRFEIISQDRKTKSGKIVLNIKQWN